MKLEILALSVEMQGARDSASAGRSLAPRVLPARLRGGSKYRPETGGKTGGILGAA